MYDVDGPRVRLGVGWFLLAFPAVVLSPFTAALVYGALGALAARQVATCWRTSQWQADLAAGLVAVPVLGTVLSPQLGLVALVVALVVGIVAGAREPAGGLRGTTGRIAGSGVLLATVAPIAVAAGAVVVLAAQNPVVIGMLLLMASAYEVGDFIIGSGGSTPVEGPLAGAVALILVGFPSALVFLEPFDVLAIWVLLVAAVACLLGQWVASALLPRPDARASALRRLDTLLVLAPLWVAATGGFS